MVGFNNFMIVFFLIRARIYLMVIFNACTERGERMYPYNATIERGTDIREWVLNCKLYVKFGF